MSSPISLRLTGSADKEFELIYKRINEKACEALGIAPEKSNYPYSRSKVIRILIRNEYEKECS